MAKPTIKGLQEQLNLYKETNELVTKDNNRLHKKIEDIKVDKGVVTKEEYDTLVNEIELLKLKVEEYKNLYEHERKKEKIQRVKNSRNAGRKPIQTEIKEKVLQLREQGSSIRNISKELNISVGTVHKIINEPSNSGNKQPMTEEEYNKYREHTNNLRKQLRDMGRTHAGTEDLPSYEEYIKSLC